MNKISAKFSTGMLIIAALSGCGRNAPASNTSATDISPSQSALTSSAMQSATSPSVGQPTQPALPDAGRTPGSTISAASVGDIVTFGVYEQDGNEANGSEPIAWDVLDTDEGGVLLISHYVLDVQPYNTEKVDVTWETCTLRAWLNDVFYNTAFSASEQEAVRTTTVITSDNPRWGTPGGNNTQDKVFLLSIDDIRCYYTFNSWYEKDLYGYSEKLIAEPTPHAINSGIPSGPLTQEAYDNYLKKENYPASVVGRIGAWWWLRSPGYLSSLNAGVVVGTGIVGTGFYNNLDVYNGVRPVLWVNR